MAKNFLDASLASISKNLLMRIKKRYPNYTNEEAQELLNKINQADPTGTNAVYTTWLVGQIIQKNLPISFNAEEVKRVLNYFNVNKTRPIWTASKEIDKFDWQDVKTTVEQAEGLRTESRTLTEHPAAPTNEIPGVKKIYDADGWQVREISTVEGLMAVSKGLIWCTKEECNAKNYLDKYGKMYAIYKNERIFAMWGSIGYVKNINNRDVEGEEYDQVFDIMMKIQAVDWGELSGINWCELLIKYPQLAKYCDWSKMDSWDWQILLSYRPQFADKCDWSKFDGKPLYILLIEQPQLARYCDWSRLSGTDWVWLLRLRPQFVDKCDWDKLSDHDWTLLLQRQPQFKIYRKSSANLTKFLLGE